MPPISFWTCYTALELHHCQDHYIHQHHCCEREYQAVCSFPHKHEIYLFITNRKVAVFSNPLCFNSTPIPYSMALRNCTLLRLPVTLSQDECRAPTISFHVTVGNLNRSDLYRVDPRLGEVFLHDAHHHCQDNRLTRCLYLRWVEIFVCLKIPVGFAYTFPVGDTWSDSFTAQADCQPEK